MINGNSFTLVMPQEDQRVAPEKLIMILLISIIFLNYEINSKHSKFALNCGIGFKTPEMFFLGEKETLPAIEWDPKTLPKSGQVIKGVDNDKIKSGDKESKILGVFCY